MPTDFLIVLITVPSLEVGERIAESLLEKKLAACVNILPGVTSIYTWKGAVQKDQELMLVVKTRPVLFQTRLVPAVKAIHPYEVPEIIALPLEMGSPDYLAWIAAETTPE